MSSDQKKKISQLEAFTIIESLVAMSLVVVTFGLGMLLYLQLLSQDRLIEKNEIRNLLNYELSQSLYNNEYIDKIQEKGNLWISQQVKPYGKTDLQILEISAGHAEGPAIIQVQQIFCP